MYIIWIKVKRCEELIESISMLMRNVEKSVDNAMAIMLTATSGPDDLFMKVIEDYIYGKISLEEMEKKIDNSILI